MSTETETPPKFVAIIDSTGRPVEPPRDPMRVLHAAHHTLFLTTMTATDKDVEEYLSIAMKCVGAAMRRLDA